jgi:hypothetical protein
VAQGYSIYLATDNLATQEGLERQYHGRIISYPKFQTRERRWPRKTDTVEDWRVDYIDLLLLSSCEYIVGSRGSSYSQLAMALNNSTRSHFA